MIFHEPQVEMEINGKFISVAGIGSLKEGDVFRTVNKDGLPTITSNVWIDGKYYASVRSWKAIADSQIDEHGRYNVDAVPCDASLGLIKYGDARIVVPTQKTLIRGMVVGAVDIVGMGILAPMLISAPSTLAVFAGFGIIGLCVALTASYLASFV